MHTEWILDIKTPRSVDSHHHFLGHVWRFSISRLDSDLHWWIKMRMIIFAFVMLPIAFSKALPKDVVTNDASSYDINDDLGLEPISDLGMGTENEVNQVTELVAKAAEYQCAQGLQFACCNDKYWHDAYRLTPSNGYTSEVLKGYGIVLCGQGNIGTFVHSHTRLMPPFADQTGCTDHVHDIRRCCRDDREPSFSFVSRNVMINVCQKKLQLTLICM